MYMNIFENIKNYIKSIQDRDPAASSLLIVLLTYPCVKSIFFHRIAHILWNINLHIIGRMISQLSRFLTGVEIHPAAKIGKNLFIDHGMGVVIGQTAEIGNNVTLYHGVTLGGISPAIKAREQVGIKRHPSIGNDVIIGSGAQILGPIKVGVCARIGSNAVVTKDVPKGAIMVGVPAKNIAKKKTINKVFAAYGVTDEK
jgi:serine O-acetyltransferase